MSFKKWKDWISVPNSKILQAWKREPANDIAAGLEYLEWQGDNPSFAGLITQKGTMLTENIMNNMQKGLIFQVNTNHIEVNNEDRYELIISGIKSSNNLDGYELVENLQFNIKINSKNLNGVSKVVIDGDVYDLKKVTNGNEVELDIEDMLENKVYKISFDGTQFFLDSFSLKATDTEPGISTITDIIKQVTIAMGGEYGGNFPVTNIEKNKVYYYLDVDGLYKPYVALYTKTGTFNTPDTLNFVESSVMNVIEGFKRDQLFTGNQFIISANKLQTVRWEFPYDMTAYNNVEINFSLFKSGSMNAIKNISAWKGYNGFLDERAATLDVVNGAVVGDGWNTVNVNLFLGEDKLIIDATNGADGSNTPLEIRLLSIYGFKY